MLRLRLEGCGTSKELGKVASIRIESNSLQVPERGEVARYEDGYWRHRDGDYINILIDDRCHVHFEDGVERTLPCGPFERLRSAGGSIWGVTPPREQLIARFGPRAHWNSQLDPRGSWPTVVVSPPSRLP